MLRLWRSHCGATASEHHEKEEQCEASLGHEEPPFAGFGQSSFLSSPYAGFLAETR